MQAFLVAPETQEVVMATVRDPVCGIDVDPATTPWKLEHGDHTHYFCSEACLRQFQADPAKYGDHHAQDDYGYERHEPPHTTTGRMTAPKFGSAGSGGLEYEPGPERHGPGHKH
jgi:YHS domain-containing protein